MYLSQVRLTYRSKLRTFRTRWTLFKTNWTRSKTQPKQALGKTITRWWSYYRTPVAVWMVRPSQSNALQLHIKYSNILLGTEVLQMQLENITKGLQDQLQCCNGTDFYLPTSCSEIAELNPHSPPGYYKISTTSGAVYCSMTTADNPASSCQDIATQHPLASSGYYWVNSSNGTAVQVYCDMERHCTPALQFHWNCSPSNSLSLQVDVG